MLHCIRIATLLAIAEGLRAQRQVDGRLHESEAYTFDNFVKDFGRKYAAGSNEHTYRASVFRDSLLQIQVTNSRAHRSWTAGIHPFMDWTATERAERLHGYKPSGSRRSMTALQTTLDGGLADDFEAEGRADLGERLFGTGGDAFEAPAPRVRSQGVCGSCWALASVAAVEGQLLKANSTWPSSLGNPQLSAQALVDCVQNPRHCGGKGGCEGATPELAFDYMRDKGLPLEANLPYRPADAGKCPVEPYPSDWARVTLAGWHALPRNQAQPLMKALVEVGPAVVAVYAHNWYGYSAGIFDECPKDSIPNHSVLARGYGVVDVPGPKVSLTRYWLIQNSWGAEWGEQGNIRLLRHDDEDSWCGIDSRPQDGSACDGEADQKVTVCGSCGLLYDAVVPQVGRIFFPHAGSFGSNENHLQDAQPPTPVAVAMEALPTGAPEQPDAATPEVSVVPELPATVDDPPKPEKPTPAHQVDLASLWRNTYAERFASDADSPLSGWLSDAEKPVATTAVQPSLRSASNMHDTISEYEDPVGTAAM